MYINVKSIQIKLNHTPVKVFSKTVIIKHLSEQKYKFSSLQHRLL